MNGYFDVVNACFQFVGAVATWGNVRHLVRVRTVRGVSVRSMAFFAVWGIWTVCYFAHLGHYLSAGASALLLAGNATWVSLYVKYRRQQAAAPIGTTTTTADWRRRVDERDAAKTYAPLFKDSE